MRTLRSLVFCLVGLGLGALPTTGEAQVTNTGPHYYTVAAGDTLWSIAQRVGVSPESIASRSHLEAPFTLRRGMRLHLPSNANLAAVAPAAAVTPASARARTAPPAPVVAQPARPAPPARPPVVAAARRTEGSSRWGRPSHPGIVTLARVNDGERVTVNLRRIGPRVVATMRHFMRSNDGSTHAIDGRLLRQLGVVSDHFGGRTIEVISAFRPRRRRQWTAHSNHNVGHAVDFRVAGVPNRVTRDFCLTLPATGCGYYPRSVFIHMDTRSESARWVDWSRPGERPRYGSEARPPADRPTAPATTTATTAPTETLPPGADPEMDDVADDTPSIRDAQPEPERENDDAPATPAPTF